MASVAKKGCFADAGFALIVTVGPMSPHPGKPESAYLHLNEHERNCWSVNPIFGPVLSYSLASEGLTRVTEAVIRAVLISDRLTVMSDK